MICWLVAHRCYAYSVKDRPEVIGMVCVGLAEFGSPDTWIEANDDEGEVWAKGIDELRNNLCGRGCRLG
jgi:hypothetical protein